MGRREAGGSSNRCVGGLTTSMSVPRTKCSTHAMRLYLQNHTRATRTPQRATRNTAQASVCFTVVGQALALARERVGGARADTTARSSRERGPLARPLPRGLLGTAVTIRRSKQPQATWRGPAAPSPLFSAGTHFLSRASVMVSGASLATSGEAAVASPISSEAAMMSGGRDPTIG